MVFSLENRRPFDLVGAGTEELYATAKRIAGLADLLATEIA
jgi:hypothetical protein